MPTNWNNQQTNNLIAALLSLKNQSEAKRFLRDLLTAEELVEFGKRWQTAQLLNQKIPYTAITKTTGLSSTTIARIARWLWRGQGGYQLILNRLSHHAHSPKQTVSGGF